MSQICAEVLESARSFWRAPCFSIVSRSGHTRLRNAIRTPPVLAPRARAPPKLEAEGVATAAFAFDQSRSWDPSTPPSDPGLSFDQTLN